MRSQDPLVLGCLASIAQAQLFSNSAIPRVIGLQYEQRHREIRRRDGTLGLVTSSANVNYIVNVTVGTPPQPITLSLDTGSSDLILLQQESAFCLASGGACPSVGYCKLLHPELAST